MVALERVHADHLGDDVEHRRPPGSGRQPATVAGHHDLPGPGQAGGGLGHPDLVGVVDHDQVDQRPLGGSGRQQLGDRVRAHHPDRTQGRDQLPGTGEQVGGPLRTVPADRLGAQPANLPRIRPGGGPSRVLALAAQVGAGGGEQFGVALAQLGQPVPQCLRVVAGQPRVGPDHRLQHRRPPGQVELAVDGLGTDLTLPQVRDEVAQPGGAQPVQQHGALWLVPQALAVAREVGEPLGELVQRQREQVRRAGVLKAGAHRVQRRLERVDGGLRLPQPRRDARPAAGLVRGPPPLALLAGGDEHAVQIAGVHAGPNQRLGPTSQLTAGQPADRATVGSQRRPARGGCLDEVFDGLLVHRGQHHVEGVPDAEQQVELGPPLPGGLRLRQSGQPARGLHRGTGSGQRIAGPGGGLQGTLGVLGAADPRVQPASVDPGEGEPAQGGGGAQVLPEPFPCGGVELAGHRDRQPHPGERRVLPCDQVGQCHHRVVGADPPRLADLVQGVGGLQQLGAGGPEPLPGRLPLPPSVIM